MKIWQKSIKRMGITMLCVLVALLSGCGNPGGQSTDDAMLEQLARIDHAVTENGWDQKSLTKVTPTAYSDDEGHEIVYYLSRLTGNLNNFNLFSGQKM